MTGRMTISRFMLVGQLLWLLAPSPSLAQQSAATASGFPFSDEEASYALFWDLISDMEIQVQARECAKGGAFDVTLSRDLATAYLAKHAGAGAALIDKAVAYAEARLLPEFAAATPDQLKAACKPFETTVRELLAAAP